MKLTDLIRVNVFRIISLENLTNTAKFAHPFNSNEPAVPNMRIEYGNTCPIPQFPPVITYLQVGSRQSTKTTLSERRMSTVASPDYRQESAPQATRQFRDIHRNPHTKQIRSREIRNQLHFQTNPMVAKPAQEFPISIRCVPVMSHYYSWLPRSFRPQLLSEIYYAASSSPCTALQRAKNSLFNSTPASRESSPKVH